MERGFGEYFYLGLFLWTGVFIIFHLMFRAFKPSAESLHEKAKELRCEGNTANEKRINKNVLQTGEHFIQSICRPCKYASRNKLRKGIVRRSFAAYKGAQHPEKTDNKKG